MVQEYKWRSLCVVCVVFLQCSEIKNDCFEFFQSQFGNPQISQLEFLLCTDCWSKKQNAGMLASNANSSSPTMWHVFEQVKAARIGVICQGASIALPFLLERLQQYSFQFVLISLSRIHLAASLYLCPAACFQDILFEQAGNSHWNKLAFLRYIKWHTKSAQWAHEKYLTWCQ